MSNRTVRRVVVAIASTAVAAAGLLATGGSASAATYPSSSRPGAVSAVRIADHHNGDRYGVPGGRGGDDRGHWKRDHGGGRHWIQYDDRDGHRARGHWVLDQIRWADAHGYTHGDGLEHHGRSHR